MTAADNNNNNNSSQPNPMHLHIDCTRGISARSFLDGLRALARSSGDENSKDAFQIDPMTAAIWAEHIPDTDRVVLQDGNRVINQETPVQSWEPYRRAIRESPGQVSEKVICQLKDLIDALEKFYNDDVRSKFPLTPSVVWHMIAVVLLLDRMHVVTTTSSAVPRNPKYPLVLNLILKDFPSSTAKGENPAITTFDGAILLKVLKPLSPISPDRVFTAKAIGKDAFIETELGLTTENLVALHAQPPETAPTTTNRGSVQPRVMAAPPLIQERKVVDDPISKVGPKPADESVQESKIADKSTAKTGPPPADDKKASPLESPLWNVEKDYTLLQTNIDDMTPEHLAYCTELLMEQGAADVWLTSITMKKGRAAQELSCLTPDDLTQKLLMTIFRQTTTLGVRVWTSKAGLQRVSLRREMLTIEYCRRSIQVKAAYLGKEPVSLKPEYDQCVALAKDTQIPLMVVTEEVKALAKDHTRRKLLAKI